MKFNLDINNINYVKIIYTDIQNEVHSCKAKIKDLGEKSIYAYAEFDEKVHIKTPQEILVCFICDDGLYRANSLLQYTHIISPNIFFMIKTPQELNHEQKRKFFRVDIDVDVLITYIVNGVKKVVRCKSHDISGNGIRVILDEAMEFPEKVQLGMFMENKEILVSARTVRYDEDGNVNKAAFCYFEIEDKDVDTICKVVFKKQLENIRLKKATF